MLWNRINKGHLTDVSDLYLLGVKCNYVHINIVSIVCLLVRKIKLNTSRFFFYLLPTVVVEGYLSDPCHLLLEA